MKFVILARGDSEIAVNKDAIAYVTKAADWTKLYLKSVDKEGKLIHFHVKEPFSDVIAKLNAE